MLAVPGTAGLLLTVLVLGLPQAQPPAGAKGASPGAAVRPPYQRLLKGADATKAAELQQRSAAAAQADRYDEAIRLAEELLGLRTQVQGGDHWQTLDQQWNLEALRKVAVLPPEKRSGWRKAMANEPRVNEEAGGQAARLEARRREVLRWCRDVLGEKHPETARSYNNVAYNLDAQGKHADAQPLYRKALELYRELLGEKHPATANSYNNVAANLAAQGKRADSQPLYQKALDLNRELLGEKHPATAASYNNLAASLAAQGKHADAQPLHQKALDLNRELLGEKHPATAASYNNVAHNLNAQGKYADAQPLYQKALELRRELLGEKHPATAASYNNLAYNLEDQGKYADAQPLYQKALDLNRELLGEKHADIATSYNNLALNLNAQGKYADAQPLLEKALELRRELLGEKHADTAASYNNLAGNLDDQGKYADAQPLLEKALELCRELLGEKHHHTATSYSHLAVNLNAQGKYADAQPVLQKALELYRELLGEKHPDTANSYNHLAVNLSAQGKYADAQPLLQKALELRRELLGEKHPDTANSYNNVALNLNAQGKYADAQPLLQKALDLNRELLGEKHPNTATSYTTLASNLAAQGKHGAAERFLVQASASYEAARLNVAARGLERAAFGAKQSPYSLLSALQAHQGNPTAAWQAAETDLARGLSDEAAVRRHAALTPKEQQQQATLAGRLQQLQPRVVLLVAKRQPSALDTEELFRLQGERRRLEAQLAELAVTLSQRELAPLAAVQNALALDAALLLWVDVSGPGVEEHWGCVVRQSGAPCWERLPGSGTGEQWTKEDSALAKKLRDTLASSAGSAATIDRLVSQLHAQRLAPLLQHLHGVKTLYAVPVGALAGIPFELLAPDYTVSYVPSGTFLAKSKDRAPPTGHRLLALADPVFRRPGAKPKPASALPPGGLLIIQVAPNSAAATARLWPGDVLVTYAGVPLNSVEALTAAIKAQAAAKEVPLTVWHEGEATLATRSVAPGKLGVALAKELARDAIANRRKTDAMLVALRGGDWHDLPGTRAEVTQLAALFGAPATVLLDSAASEQALDALRQKGELNQYRYLHFATHGEVNDVRALESVLILAQDSLPETPLPRVNEPFLNGQLSANEVLEFWKLDAELVTLSACETALGKEGGGDGLLGFAQAFLLAGSRAVCLSLWKVDDTATALLMTRFYQNLLGKRPGLARPLGKAVALAEAKRWLRELSAEEALRLTAAMSSGVVRGSRGKVVRRDVPAVGQLPAAPKDQKPFAHPRFWSAFILIGDPQ